MDTIDENDLLKMEEESELPHLEGDNDGYDEILDTAMGDALEELNKQKDE